MAVPMPRTAPSSPLDQRIQEIIARAAQEIAQAVRENIAAEVARLVQSSGVSISAALTERATASSSSSSGAAAERKRRKILCPVPGCGRPGGGPKWGWFCAEHKNLSPEEKEQARAASRAHAR